MHWTDLAFEVYFDNILKYSILFSCHSLYLNCHKIKEIILAANINRKLQASCIHI